jgi:hypothetical protein
MMFRSFLASLDALFEFGRLLWSAIDLMVLLLFYHQVIWLLLRTFLGETSVLNGFCLIWCKVSTKQPISRSAPSSPGLFLVPHFENSDSAQFNSLIFSEVLIEDSNRLWDVNSFVLSFLGITVEAVVEVDENSARIWPFGTRCWRLSARLI